MVYQAIGSDPEGTSIVWTLEGTDAAAFNMDGTGKLTEYRYDSAGRLQDTLRYLKQALQPVVVTPAKAAVPATRRCASRRSKRIA